LDIRERGSTGHQKIVPSKKSGEERGVDDGETEKGVSLKKGQGKAEIKRNQGWMNVGTVGPDLLDGE